RLEGGPCGLPLPLGCLARRDGLLKAAAQGLELAVGGGARLLCDGCLLRRAFEFSHASVQLGTFEREGFTRGTELRRNGVELLPSLMLLAGQLVGRVEPRDQHFALGLPLGSLAGACLFQLRLPL